MMITINITNSKIRDISHAMKDQLAARNITDAQGKPVGFALCSQLFSQAVFHKPFEEVQANLDNNADSSRLPVFTNQAERYATNTALLHYGQDIALVVKDTQGVFDIRAVRDCGTGSSIEWSTPALKRMASTAAEGLTIRDIHLHELLPDGWDFNDVLKLALDLNYLSDNFLSTGEHLLDFLENLDGLNRPTILIEDRVTYGLKGDWHGEVQGLFEDQADDDDNDDPLEHCIWFAEAQEGYVQFEYSFTLEDVCKAVKSGPGNTWLIHDQADDEYYTVDIKTS
jgi:hypothetical protein